MIAPGLGNLWYGYEGFVSSREIRLDRDFLMYGMVTQV